MKTDSEYLSTAPLVMFGATKDGYLSGGGAGAGDAGGAFQYAGGKITNCRLMFGRRTLRCADVPCTQEQFASADIYAVVSHSGGAPSLSVDIVTDGAERNSSLTATYRLLYAGAVDYRYMPVIAAFE